MTEQRTAVVSGGGTGIGLAIVEALVKDGAHVVALGRRPAPLERAVSRCPAGTVTARQCDVGDPVEVEVLAAWLQDAFGSIDAVVCNAGGAVRTPTDTLAALAENWTATFRANVLTSVLLTHACLPLLPKPGGRVVLVSSMASRSGGGGAAYGAAKATLNGWVLNLAANLGPGGITANVVAPGYVPDTELFPEGGLPAEMHNRIIGRMAMGRPIETTEIASVVSFLCSPGASAITGQVIEVDCGRLPPGA
ncbi:MAG: SDR family NAD(P)-dependent oxidoreductase [Acidimicrobiia bacterium]